MQCPNCHQEVVPQATFCNHCGAPLAAAAPKTPYAQPPAYTPPPTYAPPPVASAAMPENIAAAVAYITVIPAIVFLVLEPYNKMPLVRFHAFQSIGLFVAWIALQIVVMILGTILHIIPVLGALLTGILYLVVGLGLFVAWILAILKASKGEWYKLPVIGDFADKQARS